MCYAQSGQTQILAGEKEIFLEEGELAVIAPDTVHGYSAKNGNKNKVFVVCFESFSQTLKTLENSKFKLEKSQTDCVEKIIDESKNTFYMNEKELLEVLPSPNFGGQQAILLQLEYLLIQLVRNLSKAEDANVVFLSGEQFHADLVRIVYNFFNERLNDKLSLEKICDKVNYSRSFICNIFKKQTGETLLSCYNRLKIERAKQLLEKTQLSAVQISTELGFSEPKYFCAVFKKHTGLTPISYRRKNNGKT